MSDDGGIPSPPHPYSREENNPQMNCPAPETLGVVAHPGVVRCGADCGATVALYARGDITDDDVTHLRQLGWQVVDGKWLCSNDLPEDRRHLPGALGRRRNPHCGSCGDTRGGPYGHEVNECTWQEPEGDW